MICYNGTAVEISRRRIMSEQSNNGTAQFRADVPEKVEQESVRTTIVGGRPPGSGQPVGQIPRGIEVLLKKAAVDKKFRELLFDDPSRAVASIELELEPVESAMLQTFPKEHLSAIVEQTDVPEMYRRTFLGKSAAAMVLLLGGIVPTVGCPKGIRPGFPPTFPSSIPPPPDDWETFNENQQPPEETAEEPPRVYEEPQRFSFGLEYRR